MLTSALDKFVDRTLSARSGCVQMQAVSGRAAVAV
jgi:hypothetical protein